MYVYAQRNGELKEGDLEDLNKMLAEEYHESRLLLLLAQTYLRLQNRSAASACVQKSIEMNPLSCEAVNFALKSHLMSVRSIKTCLEESSVDDKSLLDVIFLMLDYHDIEVRLLYRTSHKVLNTNFRISKPTRSMEISRNPWVRIWVYKLLRLSDYTPLDRLMKLSRLPMKLWANTGTMTIVY